MSYEIILVKQDNFSIIFIYIYPTKQRKSLRKYEIEMHCIKSKIGGQLEVKKVALKFGVLST